MKSARTDGDRRIRQADRMARVLKVLRLVCSRGLWDAEAIAGEVEASTRTVMRDLKALEFAGVPVYFDRESRSYRVRDGFRFPVPNLTEDEIIGQAVASSITEAAGLDVAGGAAPTTQKIAASASEENRQLLADAQSTVAVLGLQLADHSAHQDVIRTCQQALLKKVQVAGDYRSPYQPATTQLRLNPVRLCLIKNAWYLIAVPLECDEPRTYRVARFESLAPLDAPAVTPPDFDLEQYLGNAWAVYRGSEAFDVKVRFLPEAARIVTETHWHHTQTVEWKPDRSVQLGFCIDGLEEIRNWLVTWAGYVEVIEPQALREMVVEQLRRGIELNRGRS